MHTCLIVGLVKNSDLMCKQSIWTSVISAGIASRHLKEGGLLQLTGAKPALDGGTPGRFVCVFVCSDLGDLGRNRI